MMSEEYRVYLKKRQRKKMLIHIIQILIAFTFIFVWELLARFNLINTFIFSSPSKILTTLIGLYKDNNLFNHIFITSKEVIISFILCFIISFIMALILFICPTLKKILDPYIVMFNSLPKVALGPLIIIWIGTNTSSIIFNSLLISLIVTMNTILNGMNATNKDIIKLFKVFNAKKIDTIRYLIIPSAKNEIISSLKLNLGLSEIGVIMGEFLSCKAGIGYLILYGTQVFNLSLVMTGILILLLISFIFSFLIDLIEKRI